MRVAEHADTTAQVSIATESAAQTGIRSRPLLLLERTMYRDGRTPFTSVFTIKLHGDLKESRLRQALARVQAKHPLLRCVVEDGVTGPRFVRSDRPAPIPLRIVERNGDTDWQTEIRREWVTPFHGAHEPLARLVWLRGGKTNELLLVAHHCICDGQSGIILLRDCLSAYDRAEQELASYSALGSIEDIVPATILLSRKFQRRLRWKQRLLRLTLLLKNTGRSQPACPRIPTEQMYFRRWSISPSTTLALTERCRAENVTVLAAVSLAFMQAFRDIRGAQGINKVNTMVNARRFLPNMNPDALFGLAPGVGLRTKGLPPPLDMSTNDFWARAQELKADLGRRIDRLGTGLYEKLVGLEGLHDKYSSLVDFFERPPAVRHLTFSNMGRLDLPQEYESFGLEKIYSPLVMVSPTPANTVVLSSFAGEMEFAIVSDEQSLSHVEALSIKERAMDILHGCIGTSMP
jgi:hypothetical protein